MRSRADPNEGDEQRRPTVMPTSSEIVGLVFVFVIPLFGAICVGTLPLQERQKWVASCFAGMVAIVIPFFVQTSNVPSGTIVQPIILVPTIGLVSQMVVGHRIRIAWGNPAAPVIALVIFYMTALVAMDVLMDMGWVRP